MNVSQSLNLETTTRIQQLASLIWILLLSAAVHE